MILNTKVALYYILQCNVKDSKWNKVWFPSKKPFDRREVQQLTITFDQMLQELEDGGLDPVASIEQEQRIYDIILHEIIRQVYVECTDRGVLLEKVSKRYRLLFEKVPSLLQQMQIEIDDLLDANKSLRTLLEKLMEEKSQQGKRVKFPVTRSEQSVEQSKSEVKKLQAEVAKLRMESTKYQEEITELKREAVLHKVTELEQQQKKEKSVQVSDSPEM